MAATDVVTRSELEQLRAEVDGLRRELHELNRLMRDVPLPPYRPRSREEQLASMEKVRELREAILHDRGGELLPPSAPGIAQAREERGAQVLGEWAQP